MSRIEVSRRRRGHGVLAQSPGPPPTHGNRRHDLRLGPLALVALLPFGPVHIIAISTLPVAERVRVVRRLWGLWGLVLRLRRRRRRRRRPRGHGRARRLTVGAAARVMPRLVGIVHAIAVLGTVHNSHIMVADAAHVLAVFIIPCSAAVLHCAAVLARGGGAAAVTVLGPSAQWCWETRCG